MTGPQGSSGPLDDPWAVTVHGGPEGRHSRDTDDGALGSGVLIDRSRVLTSLSVAGSPVARGGLWVKFRQTAGAVRLPVRRISSDGGLAVLELMSPAPGGARPAPLRRADAGNLVGERWQVAGDHAYGVIAAPLPAGRIRLEVEPPAHLSAESTGAGVWSVRLRAVVAVLEHDAEARTLERLGRDLPAPFDPGPDPAAPEPAGAGSRPARGPRTEPPSSGTRPSRAERTTDDTGDTGTGDTRTGDTGTGVDGQDARYRTAWIAGARRPDRVPSAGGAVTLLCRVAMDDRVLVASAAADGTVTVADAATGQARHTLRTEPGQVRALTPLRLPDATCLGIVSADGSLTAWAAEQGWGQTFTVHGGRATTATRIEGGLLAVGGADGTVEARVLGDARARWVAPAGAGPVAALCALPDLLAAAGADGAIRLLEARSGALVQTLDAVTAAPPPRPAACLAGQPGSDRPVATLCPVPIGDRTLLAAAGADGAIRLWEPRTGELRNTLIGHTAPVAALCTVPGAAGGGRIASVGEDRTARLWDPASGACELVIPLHHEASACVAAGGHLIVGRTAGTVAYSLRR